MAAAAQDDLSLPDHEAEPKTERQRRSGGAHTSAHVSLRDWKKVLARVWKEMIDDKVSDIAASLAYYAMLAVFPALIGLTSIYGMLFDPADVQRQINELSGALPWSARQLLATQLKEIVRASETAQGFGLLLSIVGVLWSASSGTSALIEAINTAYDENETRNFFKQRALALAFTLGFILSAVIAFGIIAVLPSFLDNLGLGPIGQTVVAIGRWPSLALLVIVGLSLLYRYAPNRRRARWQWINWGSIIAAIIWTLASILFSLYVTSFGSYNKTYGTLGGVIVLLLWFYVSGFVILLGAEVNAELEHRAPKDSKADTVREGT